MTKSLPTKFARSCLQADGVLVWVDPLQQGKTRARRLIRLLREVAARGTLGQRAS